MVLGILQHVAADIRVRVVPDDDGLAKPSAVQGLPQQLHVVGVGGRLIPDLHVDTQV